MSILDKARTQRENIIKAAQSLSDKDASITPELFGRLSGKGELIKTGTRINWRGQLKRATIDMWDTTSNNPDNAPILWEDISYRDGVRIIPEVITSGTAFALGELGWWDGAVYESLLNGNVWTPLANPSGWAIVKD